MKVRRLQRLNDQEQWEDHGYVYELKDGRCTFRYNPLVWESTGSRLSAKLTESGTKLEDVHQVIPATKRLHWLDIEEIEGEPDEIKARLDEACQIPRPQKVSVVKPAAS
jgi:hypothetical protein